jgi:hypothetical protein
MLKGITILSGEASPKPAESRGFDGLGTRQGLPVRRSSDALFDHRSPSSQTRRSTITFLISAARGEEARSADRD